jgi:hypothetical protein
LPGTLPYATPLGEAPAGVLVARRAALPADYANDVLVSIWEERRIVRVSLAAKGVSVAGQAKLLIEGSEDFRPVAFAADSRGTIYVTDWGRRQYPNHGRGRVWRLSVRQKVEAGPPRGEFETPLPDRGMDTLRALSGEGVTFEHLQQSVASDDPFVRSAAIAGMSDSRFRDRTIAATAQPDSRVRIGALLALQRARIASPELLVTTLLRDQDRQVRRMAMISRTPATRRPAGRSCRPSSTPRRRSRPHFRGGSFAPRRAKCTRAARSTSARKAGLICTCSAAASSPSNACENTARWRGR